MLPTSRAAKHQNVWISCRHQEDQDTLINLCGHRREVVLKPRGAKASAEDSERWHRELLLLGLPKAYRCDQGKYLLHDVDAWLFATLDSKRIEESHEHKVSEFPSLLITDSSQLVASCNDIAFRQALAFVANVQEHELVPVVLLADFGRVSGIVVDGSPMDECRSDLSFAFHKRIDNVEVKQEEMMLRFGVYLQRVDAKDSTDSSSWWPKVFGTRCLGVFADGSCAYCAISPDGIRSIEVGGTWEVVNGHLVITGATTHYFGMSRDGTSQYDGKVYDEPLFLPLSKLTSDFEHPIDLRHILPTNFESLKWRIWFRTRYATNRESQMDISASPNFRRPQLTGTRTSYFVKLHLLEAQRRHAEEADVDELQEAPEAMTRKRGTAAHNVLAMFKGYNNFFSPREERLSVVKPTSIRTPPATHRLMRAPTRSSFYVGEGEEDSDGEDVEMQRLRQYAEGLPEHEAPDVYVKDVLKPGHYFYEFKHPKDCSYNKLFKVTLRTNGTCEYFEDASNYTLQSIPLWKRPGSGADGTRWRVEGNCLILEADRPGSSLFMHFTKKAGHIVERLVSRIQVLIHFLTRQCTFTEFEQETKPFLDHVSLPSHQLVFGSLHPKSPVLKFVGKRFESIPYNEFETELLSLGFYMDEILSDFNFIDSDGSGCVTLEELQSIEAFGRPATAPEVLRSLHAALLTTWPSLDAAFEAMVLDAGVAYGKVTEEQFYKFLQRASTNTLKSQRTKAKPGTGKALADWLAKTSDDVRRLVFATLNPERADGITSEELHLLSLHTAILTIFRMRHFQFWLFQNFGQSEACLKKVYQAMLSNLKKSGQKVQSLDKNTFARAVKALGYPSEIEAIKPLFYFLDQDSKGSINEKAFLSFLQEFSAEKVISGFDELKKFVTRQFDGLDACFQVMLKTQKSSQDVSFAIFQKVLLNAGLNEKEYELNLKMLFVFLQYAFGEVKKGRLTAKQWSLMKGFNSEVLEGNPARLRRVFEEKYGSVAAAFKHMHGKCMKRALLNGLKQTAVRCFARAFINGAQPRRMVPSRTATPRTETPSTFAATSPSPCFGWTTSPRNTPSPSGHQWASSRCRSPRNSPSPSDQQWDASRYWSLCRTATPTIGSQTPRTRFLQPLNLTT